VFTTNGKNKICAGYFVKVIVADPIEFRPAAVCRALYATQYL